MNSLSQYILEKFKISKDISLDKKSYENEQILIDFLQLSDNKLIDAITDWFSEYNVIDISLQVNERTLYGFRRHISKSWDGELNQEIFKGESFLCSTSDGNFDIMKHIINGSKDYSKLVNILLYKSEKDKLNLYGNHWGLYIQQEDYEAIILKKNEDEKDK